MNVANFVRVLRTTRLGTIPKMAHTCVQSNRMFREIQIPLPWGHIAAKEWGETGKQVLCLHGHQDNANSFDTLLPLLPADMHYVAVDLPGHGKSSQRPAGSFYHITEYAMDIRRIVDALKWTKFSIIAHSMGSGIAILFTSSFPDMIEKLVFIEGFAPIPRSPKGAGERLSAAMNKMHKYEGFKQNGGKLYTKEEALDRLIQGHAWCTKESAKILFERAAKQVETEQGTKYSFTRDIRIQFVSPLSFTSEEVLSCFERITCEVLFIRASESIRLLGTSEQIEAMDRHMEKVIEVLQKSSKKFVEVVAEGNHHVHLNHPENVAPHIVEFLTNDSSMTKL